MLVFNRKDYLDSLNYIKEKGRKLDYLLIKNLESDTEKEIIRELQKYQNEDGGFGNSLEPDLRLPSSSAVATEFAINILNDLRVRDENVYLSIVKYLESTYDKEKKYWLITPPEVDEYPRAIWWNHCDVEQFSRLNPTATFIGFMYKNAKGDTTIDLDWHINEINNYIKSKKIEEFEAHELLCIIRFKSYMPDSNQNEIENKINQVIEHIIEKNPEKWVNYSPEPVKYITSREHSLYSKYYDLVDENLDFIINSMNSDRAWSPKHQWYQFDDIFLKSAKPEWAGFFTYENIKTLKAFGRTHDF